MTTLGLIIAFGATFLFGVFIGGLCMFYIWSDTREER